jgi:hypothetical protein
MADEKKPEQSPREIIEKLHAMSPEEFNRFMHENFARLCKQPLPNCSGDRGGK